MSEVVAFLLLIVAVVTARTLPHVSTEVDVTNGSSTQVATTFMTTNVEAVTSATPEEVESTTASISKEATPPVSNADAVGSVPHILRAIHLKPVRKRPRRPPAANVTKETTTATTTTTTPTTTTTTTSSPDVSYIPLNSLEMIGLLFNSSNFSSSIEKGEISNNVLEVPGELRNGSLPLAFLDQDLPITEADKPVTEEEQSNPYVHWDSDSEEQEMELHLKPNLHEEENTEATETQTTPAASPLVSRSYLILLAGNSTIVKLRQEDFAKYLKLNLAARLSLEYDDVTVNRVVLAPPRLVVNVSVVTPEASAETTMLEQQDEGKTTNDDASLHMLAETNATLLELSGEEYHVMRLLPLRADEGDGLATSLPSTTTPSGTHDDIELVIYTVLGGICVAIIFATLLRIAVQKYNNITNVSWFMPKSFYPTWNLPRHERMEGEETRHENYPTPPTVIYSGSFAAHAASSQPTWMDDDTGLNALKRPFDMDISRNYQSPSKLHIFSCRPGSVVMPIPYHTSVKSHHHTAEEDHCLGHDNPNYQT